MYRGFEVSEVECENGTKWWKKVEVCADPCVDENKQKENHSLTVKALLYMTLYMLRTNVMIMKYCKSGNFFCKNIFVVNGNYKKLIFQKLMHTIKGLFLRKILHENLSYET